MTSANYTRRHFSESPRQIGRSHDINQTEMIVIRTRDVGLKPPGESFILRGRYASVRLRTKRCVNEMKTISKHVDV